MPVPLIFVTGPVASRKTEFVNRISVDIIPDEIQQIAEERFGSKVTKFIRLPFNVSDFKDVFKHQKHIPLSTIVKSIIDYKLDLMRKNAVQPPSCALLIDGNPLFDQYIWDLSIKPDSLLQSGVYAPYATLTMLMELELYPLCMIRIPKREYTEDYVSPNCEDIKISMDILKLLDAKRSLVYQLPNKNTGPHVCIPAVTDEMFDECSIRYHIIYEKPNTVPRSSKKLISFFDGLMGAGKSTLIKHGAAGLDSVPVIEPIDIISDLLTIEAPDIVKRSIIEEGIAAANMRKLFAVADLNPNMKLVVERNIMYSDWIFSEHGSKYPTIDKRIYSTLINMDLTIGKTYYINLPLEECVERIKKRGRDCDKTWTVEQIQSIYDKLQMLYMGPLEWPLATTVVIDNPEDKSMFIKDGEYIIALEGENAIKFLEQATDEQQDIDEPKEEETTVKVEPIVKEETTVKDEPKVKDIISDVDKIIESIVDLD